MFVACVFKLADVYCISIFLRQVFWNTEAVESKKCYENLLARFYTGFYLGSYCKLLDLLVII